MAKNINQQLTPEELEKILARQTDVILNTVSEKLTNTEKSFKEGISEKLINLEESLRKEILRVEERINKKINDLIATLDIFLKRLTVAE